MISFAFELLWFFIRLVVSVFFFWPKDSFLDLIKHRNTICSVLGQSSRSEFYRKRYREIVIAVSALLLAGYYFYQFAKDQPVNDFYIVFALILWMFGLLYRLINELSLSFLLVDEIEE